MVGATRVPVLLRVDANSTVGFGHAVRSSALLAALQPDLDLTVAGDEAAALSPIFRSARIRSVEREGLDVILDGERPHLAVVDLPRHTPDLWRRLRRHAGLVVAIDDEGGAVDADIVINGAAPTALCRRCRLATQLR